ncbi:MAG: type II toxin-antitoxin system HicB family antitoxin [bacterium]
MQLLLTSKIWKEGKYYLAYNPELDIASQGKSFEQAEKMLKEAIDLFINTAKKMDTTKEILKELGFIQKNKIWFPPKVLISPIELKI